MTLLRTLRLGALLLLTSFTATSCLEPPEYPETPSIDFERITSQRIVDNTGAFDRVTITVSFRDGNGDLGMTEDEKVPGSPWVRLNPDNSLNPFYNNYYITPFIRNASGEFVEVVLSANNNYNSTFPPLNMDGRASPLRGELNFEQEFTAGLAFQSGQVVRFEVFIYDRALNKSNTVVTDPITFP